MVAKLTRETKQSPLRRRSGLVLSWNLNGRNYQPSQFGKHLGSIAVFVVIGELCNAPFTLTKLELVAETPLIVVVARNRTVSASTFIITLPSIAFATGIRPRHHNPCPILSRRATGSSGLK